MNKNRVLVGLGAVALSLALAACGSNSGKSGDKTLHVTLQDEPMTIDPNKATDVNSASMLLQSYEGLYTYDANNKLKPGVATKVVKPTNHGLTYTFNLRQDAKWSNGDPVTAQDFVYSFQRTVDPKTKAQFASYYANFKNFDAIQAGKMAPSKLGVKALGKYKLQVTLAKQMPWFNDIAASKYLPLNEKAVNKYGAKYGTSADKAVYNGPYKVADWTGTNNSWNYVKNNNYWNKKNVKIQTVKVTVTKDQNTAVNMFNSGDVQETTVNGQYVRQNSNNKNLKTHLLGRLQYLYFNNKKAKTNSENLRQALSYVTDRQQLTSQVLQDGSKPALSAVIRGDQQDPATGKDMATSVGNLLPTDVTKAKQYWAKYLKETGKKTATFNLLTDDTDEDKNVGQYLQSTIEKELKGAKVTLTSIPHAQHVARDFAGQFDLNLTGWTTNWLDSADFLSLAQKGNTVNFTNWSDPTFNKLMTTQAGQTGQTRYDTLAKADKYLMKVKGFVPLYQPAESKLVSSKVGGLNYSLLNEAQYQYAYWK
ncbi:peptide ABC transporter substrate-binding protein [Secundilactobacillus kimchicus]|uniref:ABC-type oligopeptide transport system, periplasmic component n=1 Tax=Secundilactobacillus kimchicus JCM 15530 TaxID=1302272 RepID=A0A0R1HKC0_9LACO|nr:peptide ABC transporter substrate-binding protein [Secundilactobacillus kimchicus]KRK46815.1 ABC-type oligopeptide transport system, periplasmic component [Secundilactobacillus kimchicus JCM 15530]MBT9672705.1 peptide ABC transporter substrate-binding protein [Secundilactobacillus kimchicus]